MEEPRATYATIYYGGDILGTFSVHTTPAMLQFDEPKSVIAELKNIKNMQLLTAELGKTMPINAGAICQDGQKEKCGTIKPDHVGIIFDTKTLSGELFINPSLLSVDIDENARYLPLPSRRKLASVHSFTGAVSGTSTESPSFSLASNGVYSFGEAHVKTASSVSDQGLRFDTVAAEIERKGWAVTGGLFRSRSSYLVSDADIAGLSFGSSSRTVIDREKTSGNDIIVYLPRRSFVSIYREGRIYSSRLYESGNQLIDTADLPDGAYDIILKIQEPDGNTREERRFFAKTADIPPIGYPYYYVEAGVIRKSASADSTMPQLTDLPVARAGITWRLDDNIGIGTNALAMKDRAISETGIHWLHGGMKASASALISSKGDAGFGLSYQYIHDRVSAAMDVRQTWVSTIPEEEYQTLLGEYLQASGGFAYTPTDKVTFGFRANYSSQEDNSNSSISAGPYAQWRIWQEGENSLNFDASTTHTEERNKANALLIFTKRFGNYGITSTSGARTTDNGTSPTGSMRGWYEKDSPGHLVQVAAGANGDKDTQTASAEGLWRNRRGQFEGSVQQSFSDSGNTLGYGGSFSVNTLQTGSDLYVGGTFNDESAVVIKTTGLATGKTMDIFVNGSPRSSVTVGDSQVIYLSPFQTYNIRIRARDHELLTYEGNDRKVTLYPGNATTLEWKVDKFLLLIGRVVDTNGIPIAGAVLKDSRDQVFTDDDGRIQAEMTSPTHMIFKVPDKDGATCTVTPDQSVKERNGVMIYKHDLICVDGAVIS